MVFNYNEQQDAKREVKYQNSNEKLASIHVIITFMQITFSISGQLTCRRLGGC